MADLQYGTQELNLLASHILAGHNPREYVIRRESKFICAKNDREPVGSFFRISGIQFIDYNSSKGELLKTWVLDPKLYGR